MRWVKKKMPSSQKVDSLDGNTSQSDIKHEFERELKGHKEERNKTEKIRLKMRRKKD